MCYNLSMDITQTKDFLARARSITEWDQLVENIRVLNNGVLPAWWDKEIVKSGFAEGQRLSFDSQLQKRKDEE